MVSSDGGEVPKGDDEDNLQRFLHWMEVNGIQLRNCNLKPCEENSGAGLGVYTTDSHPEDGILVVTPLVLAITPMTALQDPLLGSVFAKVFEDGDVDDRLVVMLFLLVERLRGEASFWAPYLKMLPTKFGMTLCFTEEELLELKGTALYRATKLQQTSLKQHFYEKVKGLAETILASVGWIEREVEFEDFLWANCIFWTRALNVPCPQSLVSPKSLQTPVSWLCKKEQGVVDGTAVVEGLRLESGNSETLEVQEHGSTNSCPHSQHHGKDVLGCSDKSQMQDLSDHVLAGDAVKITSTDNDSDVGTSSQPLANKGTGGGPEPEMTIWVEGLVPGIDFCNHANQAAAVWEVDDQKGSASGVQYSMYLVTVPDIGLPSNTEVRINYGNKGNEELLYLYGFVLDNNPDDYLMVSKFLHILELGTWEIPSKHQEWRCKICAHVSFVGCNCKVHFPKEALEHGVCSEAKFLLLEEQRLPLRWLLPLSLLNDGYVNQQNSAASAKSESESSKHRVALNNYSWSGHRKPPPDLEKQVFPEDLMAALRIIAMTEEEVQGTTGLLQELSEPEQQRVPSAEDIRAAVWEVCGNGGALQLLQDLLTSKILEIEEGTGSEDGDTYLLHKDAEAKIEVAKKRQHGSAFVGDEEFIHKYLLSRNKRGCVVYRKGQKHMAKCFLQEAEYALRSWIT